MGDEPISSDELVRRLEAIVAELNPITSWQMLEELSADSFIPVNQLKENVELHRDKGWNDLDRKPTKPWLPHYRGE